MKTYHQKTVEIKDVKVGDMRLRGVEKQSDSFRVTCNSAWLARLTLFMMKGETLEIHCIG